MAETERLGRAQVRSLTLDGVAIPKVLAGSKSVTGTGTVIATGFTTITSVVATLGENASLFAGLVTATWNGTTATITVWKPTSAADNTPIAASSARTVNYVITGS